MLRSSCFISAQTNIPNYLKHSWFYKLWVIFLNLCSFKRNKQECIYVCASGCLLNKTTTTQKKDFLSFLFCVKKANLVNYFHLVHKVIILMLFTSMLKICSLVKMKVTLISPKAFFFHLVMYIA